MASIHQKVPTTLAQKISCDDVEMNLAALVEGSLSPASTVRMMFHIRSCSCCRDMVHEFRRFVTDVPTSMSAELGAGPEEEPRHQPQSSPFWQQWQARLERWLDDLFPNTVMQPAYRGEVATAGESNHWEYASRRQATNPLLFSQKGPTQLVLHVARGFVFGRVGGNHGEPRYPVLLTLRGGAHQEPILNQPDGTFLLRWDPDATEIECQSPTGAMTRFVLPE